MSNTVHYKIVLMTKTGVVKSITTTDCIDTYNLLMDYHQLVTESYDLHSKTLVAGEDMEVTQLMEV